MVPLSDGQPISEMTAVVPSHLGGQREGHRPGQCHGLGSPKFSPWLLFVPRLVLPWQAVIFSCTTADPSQVPADANTGSFTTSHKEPTHLKPLVSFNIMFSRLENLDGKSSVREQGPLPPPHPLPLSPVHPCVIVSSAS